MPVTEPQELLGEITDVLVHLTQCQSLLVHRLQGIRLDTVSGHQFAQRVDPPIAAAIPSVDAKFVIDLVPTRQVVIAVPPMVNTAVTSPRVAKRDYDFFAELDAKLEQLAASQDSSQNGN